MYKSCLLNDFFGVYLDANKHFMHFRLRTELKNDLDQIFLLLNRPKKNFGNTYGESKITFYYSNVDPRLPYLLGLDRCKKVDIYCHYSYVTGLLAEI